MSGLDKAVVWRERLRRQERSELTVAEFCDREGVSVPSFYQWRKKLAQMPRGATRLEAELRPSPPGCAGKPPAFQQVMVAPGRDVVAIALESGVQIEVPCQHVEVVRAVVAELVRVAGRSTGGGSC